MKLNKIGFVLLILLFSFKQSLAVLDETNLPSTLSELRYELVNEVKKLENRKRMVKENDLLQHNKIVRIIDQCNKLSLILYSQNPEWTFDLTYAYKQITKEYSEFNANKVPYDALLVSVNSEIERYGRLLETLRRLPPILPSVEGLPDSLSYRNDSIDQILHSGFNHFGEEMFLPDGFDLSPKSQEDRDSCIYYAVTIIKMFAFAKNNIENDSKYYNNSNLRLKEAYDYVQNRYREMHDKLFFTPIDNYFVLCSNIRRNYLILTNELSDKYIKESIVNGVKSKSEWKGSVILSYMAAMILTLLVCISVAVLIVKIIMKKKMSFKQFNIGLCCGLITFFIITLILSQIATNNFVIMADRLVFVAAWITNAILVCILIQTWNGNLKETFKFYVPMISLLVIVFMLRIIFASNTMLNLFMTPTLLLSFIWQIWAYHKYKLSLKSSDVILGRITMMVILLSFISSFFGYVFFALMLVVWWFFQVAAIMTLKILTSFIKYLRNKRGLPELDIHSYKGDIVNTWFFDMVEIAVIPMLYIWIFIVCILNALRMFDMVSLFELIMKNPIFSYHSDDNVEITINVYMLFAALGIFFLFRYLNYLAKSLYGVINVNKIKSKTHNSQVVLSRDVNISLVNNIISLIVWGVYSIILLILFKIPTDAITMIITGLAAGIGMAMKDIMNNFIYAIQLMSGKLKIGDWIECDGIRGEVIEISYQSTQIKTDDDAIVSFLNSDLFGKNFKNLTKNNNYQQVDLSFLIPYGSDIEKVRTLLDHPLNDLLKYESFGQPIVDPNFGFNLIFNQFGDFNITIAIKLNILVHKMDDFKPIIYESIYSTLRQNNLLLSVDTTFKSMFISQTK